MKIRPYTTLLAATLLLASCTQEEVQGGGCVMSFRMISEDSVSTRAVNGINDNATFIFPADFTVAVDGANYMFTANSAGTNMIGWSLVAFPVSGASVQVLAFYPALLADTQIQSFAVRNNQNQTNIGTNNYRISDLMVGMPAANGTTISWGTGTWNGLDGNGKVKPTEDAIPLVFEHKMVKIRVNVNTNSATVKQIRMINVKRSIDFDTNDITFSNLDTADDGLGDNVIMYDDITGTKTNFVCTALIPKQNLTADTPFIEVVLGATPSDVTLTYTLHADANFNPGKQYIYNLDVSMDKLDVSCSIADWNTSPVGWTDVIKTVKI